MSYYTSIHLISSPVLVLLLQTKQFIEYQLHLSVSSHRYTINSVEGGNYFFQYLVQVMVIKVDAKRKWHKFK